MTKRLPVPSVWLWGTSPLHSELAHRRRDKEHPKYFLSHPGKEPVPHGSQEHRAVSALGHFAKDWGRAVGELGTPSVPMRLLACPKGSVYMGKDERSKVQWQATPLPVRASSFLHQHSLLHYSATTNPEQRGTSSGSQGLDKTNAYGSLLSPVWLLEIAALPTEERAGHFPSLSAGAALPSSGRWDNAAETSFCPSTKRQLWCTQQRLASLPDKVGQPLRDWWDKTPSGSGPGAALWNGRAPLPLPSTTCPLRLHKMKSICVLSAVSVDPYRITTYIVHIKKTFVKHSSPCGVN